MMQPVMTAVLLCRNVCPHLNDFFIVFINLVDFWERIWYTNRRVPDTCFFIAGLLMHVVAACCLIASFRQVLCRAVVFLQFLDRSETVYCVCSGIEAVTTGLTRNLLESCPVRPVETL